MVLPTPCPGWSVHDLAAHILGDEVGQLSMGRDGFQASLIIADDWDGLLDLPPVIIPSITSQFEPL